MSMFGDISWGSKDIKECESTAQLSFSLCREDVQQDNGHSSNLDHGKRYSVSEDSPQGEWDRIAEQMILTFAESTHLVFLIHESVV